MTTELTEELKQEVLETLLGGLFTDGAHHKQ